MFPSNAELKVLAALNSAANGMYGLQIVDAADGEVPRSAIYVLLGRLEVKGYVSVERPLRTRKAGHPGLPRPIYTLTPDGRRIVKFASEREAADG